MKWIHVFGNLIFTHLPPRLVPDTRDLLGARMLLTMTPEDGEEMKKAGETMTPELAQKAVEKAMTESPEFKVSKERGASTRYKTSLTCCLCPKGELQRNSCLPDRSNANAKASKW